MGTSLVFRLTWIRHWPPNGYLLAFCVFGTSRTLAQSLSAAVNLGERGRMRIRQEGVVISDIAAQPNKKSGSGQAVVQLLDGPSRRTPRRGDSGHQA